MEKDIINPDLIGLPVNLKTIEYRAGNVDGIVLALVGDIILLVFSFNYLWLFIDCQNTYEKEIYHVEKMGVCSVRGFTYIIWGP